jgi:hypothetical protein
MHGSLVKTIKPPPLLGVFAIASALAVCETMIALKIKRIEIVILLSILYLSC